MLLWEYDVGTLKISVQYQSWRGEALGFLCYLKESQFGQNLPGSLFTGPLEPQSISHSMFACVGGYGQPGGEGNAADMSFKDAQKILRNPPKGSDSLGSAA